MKARCYDKDFKYVNAINTDIRKTFERIKRKEKEKPCIPAIVPKKVIGFSR